MENGLKEVKMKKHMKSKIRHLVETENDKGKAVNLLKKRYNYLKSKLGQYRDISNQMKYVAFHIRRLGGKV
jgi:hypothetical protein